MEDKNIYYTFALDLRNNIDSKHMDNKQFCYNYPRPAVATDCVIFGYDELSIKVLLIERGIEPFKGKWALPGGFLEMNETIEQATNREVMEETNVDIANTCYAKRYNIAVFDEPNRDSRQRVISFLSTAVISGSTNAVAGDDATELKWFSLRNLPPLAFDHMSMINKARKEQNF